MTTPQNFIYKLSDYLQENNALQKIINKFQTDYSLVPCIGVEIEFFLSKNIDPLELQTLLGIVVKKEKGDNQFEIDLPPSTNIIEYIGKISSTKSKIQIIAKKLQGRVNFSAKPFSNDYGSSMHFHVNFIDSSALMNSVANPMSFPRRRESSVGCHSHKSRNLYPCLRRDDTEEKMSFPRRRESSVGCHSHKSRNLYPCLRRDDTEEKMSFPRRRESSVGCHSHESRNLEPCLHRDDTEEKMSFPRRRESSVGCHSHESRNLEPCLHRDDTKLSKDNTDILDLMGRSICHYMLDSFLIFMPNEDDYLRLDKNFMAPTNVSFGNNNRTVAVRIPDSSPRRVEHRIASPLTDPYLAIFTILNSILLGLEFPDKINNINKIYGNAFDQQYNLVPLPKSLAEALELFNLQFFLTNLDISI